MCNLLTYVWYIEQQKKSESEHIVYEAKETDTDSLGDWVSEFDNQLVRQRDGAVDAKATNQTRDVKQT